MKIQLIFKTKAECDAYFGNGPIPSKYMVIIEEYALQNGAYVTNSILSSTNNIEQGTVIEIGESALSYAYNYSDEFAAYNALYTAYTYLYNSYTYATEQSDEILVGNEQSEITDIQEG